MRFVAQDSSGQGVQKKEQAPGGENVKHRTHTDQNGEGGAFSWRWVAMRKGTQKNESNTVGSFYIRILLKPSCQQPALQWTGR